VRRIEESELILNKDGSIFHLHLLPEHIADNVILVGDQNRVEVISKHFDKIEYKIKNREFYTNTGYYKGKRISVVSTGIGTDNIDIVLNELDAICNIDLKTRTVKNTHKTLNFVRVGTSGAIQTDIPIDTPIITKMSIGFDGLLAYYDKRDKISNLDIEKAFIKHTNWYSKLATPYFVEPSVDLLNKIGHDMIKGMTISATGFYGPQGRVLRLPLNDSKLNDKLSSFKFDNSRITNFEMESSAIYGLSKLLGHNAVTICNIIANRSNKKYSADYKKSMEVLIQTVLDRI